MAWSPIDKISYEQLNSALQTILNNKTDLSLYNNLNNTVDYHIKTSSMHVSDEDRDKWNYVYDKMTSLLDSTISSNLVNLSTLNTTVNNHIQNMSSHWSDIDRNNYTVFVNNTNTDLSKFHSHETNDNIHVTVQDKNNWNKAVADLATLANDVRVLKNLI